MKIYLLGAFLASALIATSCGDKTKSNEVGSGEWIPRLDEKEKLLQIVELAPAEVRPLKGVIENPGIYGISVRESWALKDRMDADGKEYSVYLRSPSSSPDQPNCFGTIMHGASKLTPGDGIVFEIANETPLPVTVAIFSKE